MSLVAGIYNNAVNKWNTHQKISNLLIIFRYIYNECKSRIDYDL